MTELIKSCDGCTLSSRRSFIRDVMGAALSALIAVGVAPLEAIALPVDLGGRGEERRSGGVVYPIPAANGVSIDKKHDVILVRWDNAVYSFNLSCPHQNTALKWNDGSHRFKCPKHGSQYTPDGNFITGRATRGMDRLPISRENDSVVVDTSTVIMQDKNAALWAAAMVKLS